MEIRVKENAKGLECFDKETLELIASSLEIITCECGVDCNKMPCVEPNKCSCND